MNQSVHSVQSNIATNNICSPSLLSNVIVAN
jgi:hypothetical protein